MGKISHLIDGLRIKRKYYSNQRNSSIWVFGEWFGEKCCDNSKYFANYIAESHPKINIMWVTKNGTDVTPLHSKVNIVLMDSIQALKAMSECGVAVISQGFQDLSSTGLNFVGGAVSVNLWHGIPWKKIGHDGSRKDNLIYNIYKKINDIAFSTDFYVSPSDKYDSIARSAHGAKSNQIIHAGYARNSDFYSSEKINAGKRRTLGQLQKLSPRCDFSKSKIVSYMPTFRNEPSHSRSLETLQVNQRLTNYLEKKNVILIQKAHFINQIRDGRTNVSGSNRIYSLNNIAAQDLLSASDLLITDYSGAFFDFLILDRPIVHYLYDYDYYRAQDRGLYYDKEDVIAGEEADDEEQLVDAIIRNLEKPDIYEERRRKIRKIYMKYDTPDSCEVLYQAILKELKRRNFNESTDS